MPAWSNPLGPEPQAAPLTKPLPAQPPTWGQHDDRIPSVACLLYLVADEVIPPTIAWNRFPTTIKVPCRRAWVHGTRFTATIMTATYLSLRNSGHLALGLVEAPGRSVWRRRARTMNEATVELLDATPPSGVPGVVLKATQVDGDLPWTPYFPLRDANGRTISVLEMVKDELVELNHARYAAGVLFRPDCAKVAELRASVCADAVRWWQWVQAAEAPLVSRLLERFLVAFKGEGGGGG